MNTNNKANAFLDVLLNRGNMLSVKHFNKRFFAAVYADDIHDFQFMDAAIVQRRHLQQNEHSWFPISSGETLSEALESLSQIIVQAEQKGLNPQRYAAAVWNISHNFKVGKSDPDLIFKFPSLLTVITCEDLAVYYPRGVVV